VPDNDNLARTVKAHTKTACIAPMLGALFLSFLCLFAPQAVAVLGIFASWSSVAAAWALRDMDRAEKLLGRAMSLSS
jgi:hypothetical protein